MSATPRKIPSYCRHKATGQAVVRILGRDMYLGKYGTPESYERYHRLIAEHFPNGLDSPPNTDLSIRFAPDLTVIELIAAYWDHAKSYYVKNDEPTSELKSIRLALRPLKELYGRTLCREFGPLALDVVRSKMIDAGLTRTRINQHIGRIRRMFRWGAAKEFVPVDCFQSLTTLDGLRKGRTRAKESKPVTAVPLENVQATLPFLTAQIQAMVRFQYTVGCRPGEVTIIRPCDVERDSGIWIYRPDSHKTEHHDLERRIAVGPEGQQILAPWLNRPQDSYCFSPKEARDTFDEVRKRNRKTQHTPTSRRRKRKSAPRRKPGNRYTAHSYGRAIAKACEKAGVPHWTPNQLRHARGTNIRRKFGLEGSQVVLGHAKADVTQIYAERDFEFAKRIMREIG